jgi:hypothetical protein
MESNNSTSDYKNGYTKGFSQVVTLFEYLCSKGYEQEVILDHLKKMLEEDIRPWQKKKEGEH